jgi:two-component system, LytTR family, sensor kinase
MKIRWRQHEVLLAGLLTLAAIAGLITKGSANWPQVGLLLLLLTCVLWINLLIVPFIVKAVANRRRGNLLFAAAATVLQLGAIAFVLALGANVATYYLQPHLTNYAGFGLLALFGYNDQPLTNYFAGFERGLALVGFYALYIFARETVIHRLEREEGGRLYRTMVCNQATLALTIFIAIPVVLRSFDLVPAESSFFTVYLFFVPPVILMYLLNTYYLFPKNEGKAFINLKNLVLWVFFALLCTFPFFAMMQHKPWDFFAVFIALQLWVVTPVSWFMYRQRKDRILQLRGVETSLLKSEADLQFLRTQINPHFLFNSLNTLYSTALQEDAGKTAEGVQKLGDMMRFMLHENHQDRIPVSLELEYLENYISFQKLRIQSSAGLAIEEDLRADCSHQVAPMLLVPLVENAFKHGISMTSPSWIKIRLWCEAKSLNFEVRNSVHSLRAADPEYKRSGIGLANVRNRLLLLYKNRHQFVYGEENNEFVARLSLQV